VATTETIKELVERLTTIENEIKLLQTDRKELLADFSDRVDSKAFRAAWSLHKAKKRVDEAALDQILEILDKNSLS
tara:strand:+ start:303 stop:530 length:228 start_codon:yes stop_codon:yes gene_type:complete